MTEWYRGTNTGILMLLGNSDSVIITSGLREDEARLADILRQEADNTIVMFPSADSITFAEYLSKTTLNHDPVASLETQMSQLKTTAPTTAADQPSSTRKKMNGSSTIPQSLDFCRFVPSPASELASTQ